MGVQLDHIPEGDWNGVGRLLNRLRTIMVDTGGQSIGVRFGSTAINTGTTQTISHGLGRTPVAVFTSAANAGVAVGVDLFGATSFRMANNSGTNTTAYWLAVG